MAYFMLQKRPDGASQWSDVEGQSYNFSQRLPNAKRLCKNDLVLFYRPLKSGTPEDGCIFALATVASVELGDGSEVDAHFKDYKLLPAPIPLSSMGDPRANPQHSFAPLPTDFARKVLQMSVEPPAQP